MKDNLNNKIVFNLITTIICILFFVINVFFKLSNIEGITGSVFMLIGFLAFIILIINLFLSIKFLLKSLRNKEKVNILNIIILIILGLPLLLLIILFLGLGTFGG